MKLPRLFRPWLWPVASLLRGAAMLTLVALGFMVWSMLDPTPLPVMLAMSLGQALGTLAFALYGIAIFNDLRRIRRERRESSRRLSVPPEADT
jgi:membrane protein implicated in regulation of membrane protease activity